MNVFGQLSKMIALWVCAAIFFFCQLSDKNMENSLHEIEFRGDLQKSYDLMSHLSVPGRTTLDV